MNCKEKYDLIFTDAYNDLSIPYHLTTREFMAQLKNILTPNGIIMSNIIDNFQKGAFLPSYMRMLGSVFGQENIYLISVSPNLENTKIGIFIVLAGNSRIDIKDFTSHIKHRLGGRATAFVVPEGLMNNFMNNRYSILITDDHAPVDNLIAHVFEEWFGYNRRS